MENTTTDANTSQSAADVSSTSQNSTDNTDEKSLTDGFWGDEDSGEQSEGESKTDETQEIETEDKSEDKSEEKPEFPKAEKRKAQLNDEIRGLVSRREELKREVAEYEGIKQLQSSINENRITPEQLEAAGLDPQDAAIQALLYNQELDQQQSQVNEISANIADLQYNMSLDRVELLKDYPVFDETSPEYNADFTKKAADMYVSAANLQFNEEGAPISADKKLYEFMTDLHGIYEEGLKAGGKKISRAKQSAAVMNAGGAAASEEVTEKQFVNGFFD
nr:MAG TPA: hypothetical protein [Caudoviricetes sp.]